MQHIDFSPVTNREDWMQEFQVIEEEDASVIDITGAEISMTVRHRSTQIEMLSAEIGFGLTLTDPTNGIFEFEYTAEDMAGLDPGTYDHGIVLVLAGGTTQMVKGTVPVLDGVVNSP